ncbi:MAG: response regulator [Desulfobacteraceae bacterium]|jgi:DNA-binding NtrC family response regulator|nr:MAG: response regulator [Desulfobacteraceae bacterium]
MSTKVLIVDDEKDFLEVLGERMTVRGMDVQTTTSAKDALKISEEQTFDAIVLDLMMPEMDGIEVLKNIKAKHPEMQVILLTGHGTVEKGVEAMRLGAMDFIEKPADLEALTDKIKKAQARKMILVERKAEEEVREILISKGW